MQVAGVDTGFAHLFTIEFEDEAEHAVGGGVHGAHIEHDTFAGDLFDFSEDVFPVTALGEDFGNLVNVDPQGRLGRVDARVESLCVAHQLYDLRESAGGTVAPLYSTGIPPRGSRSAPVRIT